MLRLGREIFTDFFYLLHHPSCSVLDNLCAEINIAVTFCDETVSIGVAASPVCVPF